MNTLEKINGSTHCSERFIDLHTHSNASDGTDTPSELIDNAIKANLEAVALTDHDTTEGIDEFLRSSHGKNIIAIPGVELSTRLYDKEFHIVGLFIDHKNDELAAALEKMREGRSFRNEKMIERLRLGGYQITLDEVASYAGGECIGRPHFAAALIAKGYFENNRDAFAKCLGTNTRFYVPRIFLPHAECTRLIHAARGIAIWAHPLHGQSGERAFLRKFIKIFMGSGNGIDGIEAYYSLFNQSQTKLVMEQCAEFGLLASGGSDYHGKNIPDVELGIGYGGLRVPFELYEKMEERISKLRLK